jgi:hypothetical protein
MKLIPINIEYNVKIENKYYCLNELIHILQELKDRINTYYEGTYLSFSSKQSKDLFVKKSIIHDRKDDYCSIYLYEVKSKTKGMIFLKELKQLYKIANKELLNKRITK